MEIRVTYRTSEETVKRLQELADKYGVSQSGLLTMLVNERWLAEKSIRSSTGGVVSVSSGSEASQLVSGLAGHQRVEVDGPSNAQTVDEVPEPPPNFPEYVQPVGGKKKKRRRRR